MPTEAQPVIEFGPSLATGTIRLVRMSRLAGDCVPFVARIEGTRVLLRDGTGFDLQSKDTTTDGTRLGSAVLTTPAGFREVERARALRILSATSIDNFADGKDSYAAIVKRGRRWQVVAFTLTSTGHSDYHVLVGSEQPLEGLAYSSSPDSAAGILTMLQRVRGGDTFVIELYWIHNYFGPFAPSR